MEEKKWIKLKMNWWMVVWLILLIVSNVKVSFSSWREDLKMRLKLHKMAKKLIKNIFKNLLTIVFFVRIVRQNNVRPVKIHHTISVGHANNIKSWKRKSIFYINFRKCRYCNSILPLGYMSSNGIRAFDDVCNSDEC